MQSITNIIINEERARRIRGIFSMQLNKPYENNLHTIMKIIRESNIEYWVSVDSDNPPLKNIIDLVFLGKDIIGCPTPIWSLADPKSRPIYLSAYKKVVGGYTEFPPPPTECLQEVDAIGTGCFMLSRRVICHKDLVGGFTRRVNADDGVVELGNDLSFCERAKEAGFKIYAHYGYLCDHIKELSLLSVARRCLHVDS